MEEYDIYGDPRYDLCKLNHSIEGDYDFFVNGLFELNKLNKNQFTLHCFLSDRQNKIKTV